MYSEMDRKMKRLEVVYEQRVPKEQPFLIRLDGARFSRYTRQAFFKQDQSSPFSIPFTEVMIGTAEALLHEFRPASVYTSSDEITMVFQPIAQDKLDVSEHIYSGRVQKLASLTASYASAKFNELLRHLYPERQLAFFDARVFSVPDKAMAAENIKWRANTDAARNSYSKLAQFHLGAKKLHDLTKQQVREALEEKGVLWEDLSSHIKYGSIWKSKKVLRRCVKHNTGEEVEALRTSTMLTSLSKEILHDDESLQQLLFD